MQIACKRFGCQKAVEVCYWACKFRRNCKDWQGALDGEPGLVAIRERLESAAAKSGRLFDSATMLRPARAKRIITAPRVESTVQRDLPVSRLTAKAITKPKELTKKKMTKKNAEDTTTSPQPESETRKTQTPLPKKRAQRAKPARNGVTYLLLEKNGKYKEVPEKELPSEAARMLKDPSLRLVKGQFLIPQISLRPASE